MHLPDRSTTVDERNHLDTWTNTREPVHIADRVLHIDGRALEAYSRHIDDILVAFIDLVRAARWGDAAVSMSFRRMDIDVIADDLGCAATRVIDHLAALVGADVDHVESMYRSYDAGATMIDTVVADVVMADDGDDDDADRPAR